MRMAESLNEEEIRVLDYLKRLVKEENRRIEFNINDVSASLSMPE
jgi:nucleoside-triphosphatase THEP1